MVLAECELCLPRRRRVIRVAHSRGHRWHARGILFDMYRVVVLLFCKNCATESMNCLSAGVLVNLPLFVAIRLRLAPKPSVKQPAATTLLHQCQYAKTCCLHLSWHVYIFGLDCKCGQNNVPAPKAKLAGLAALTTLPSFLRWTNCTPSIRLWCAGRLGISACVCTFSDLKSKCNSMPPRPNMLVFGSRRLH